MTALMISDAFTCLIANELHYYQDQGASEDDRA